ncbi:GH25 family lysozyme [Chachezhania antarctica]|uniref:GH25 family lysozyme n=1 Tax=Chachezhania antarctica TaxID=2340860 RepID=UPI000EB11BF7|nr:GH25 family lysozyme [Chachezhania antarctica]|tara:strand:- start:4860 stop:5633 length:774 start_codon:yes stop_codon:yes gene_type:complete
MGARILSVLLILLLVACGQKPVTNVAVLQSGPSNFGDLDPTDWGGPGPRAYPIHGLDISRFQEPINWDAARNAGVRFAFIKATEGGDLADPRFREHSRGAELAGVPHAAYHFYYWCRPAAEQAAWFIRNVPRGDNRLPHVLDMEWTPFSPTCTIRPPGDVVRREAKIFLDILEKHYGRRPIIYTTPDFFEDTHIGRLSRTDFWLRSVSQLPHKRYEGRSWLFWQYTSTGVVPGVQGGVDINVFNGSAEDWLKFTGAR